MKKIKVLIMLIIMLIIMLELQMNVVASSKVQYTNVDIYSPDFLITILVNLVLTIFGYCTVPIILRLKNGKYEYKKGHKIVLINCAIVWFIFTIIKIEQGLNATGGAVILYYFIDKAILLKPKEEAEGIKENKKDNYSLSFENEKVEKNPNLTYFEDMKLEKVDEQKEEKQADRAVEKTEPKKVEPVKIVEKVVETKEDKTLLYVIIGILAVAFIGIAIYSFALRNTDETKIEDLEFEISALKNHNARLNESMMLYESYEEKAEFLDERIVFVIDGYGNYYYTYDQMKTVTQGIGEYTFWAYNKEQAISRGYKAWK